MDVNGAFPQADALYPDLNERMRDIEMGYLMRIMKRLFPTYSDTPGMGNMTPWRINDQNLESPTAINYMKMSQKLAPLPMNERMGLEKLLMEHDLRQMYEGQQYWGTRPRFGQNGPQWENPNFTMRLPGSPSQSKFRM